jgi:hypothetical protein
VGEKEKMKREAALVKVGKQLRCEGPWMLRGRTTSIGLIDELSSDPRQVLGYHMECQRRDFTICSVALRITDGDVYEFCTSREMVEPEHANSGLWSIIL